MRFITAVIEMLREFNYAREAGITNDAGIMSYFRAEYKKNAEGAYDYWVSTNSTSFMSK